MIMSNLPAAEPWSLHPQLARDTIAIGDLALSRLLVVVERYPDLKLIAVAATGAYCRAMASNYNHVGRPPVVAVRDGSARVLLRRESIEDLLRLDAG